MRRGERRGKRAWQSRGGREGGRERLHKLNVDIQHHFLHIKGSKLQLAYFLYISNFTIIGVYLSCTCSMCTWHLNCTNPGTFLRYHFKHWQIWGEIQPQQHHTLAHATMDQLHSWWSTQLQIIPQLSPLFPLLLRYYQHVGVRWEGETSPPPRYSLYWPRLTRW